MPADPTDQLASDWRAERACPICWTTFTPAGPRHRYCSDRCRKHAHLRRQAEPAATNRVANGPHRRRSPSAPARTAAARSASSPCSPPPKPPDPPSPTPRHPATTSLTILPTPR